jgi:predicted GIY-YIG superfamily endonuclease
MFTLYILECSDGTLYIGHTDKLDERMSQHDSGGADSYTSKRRPVRLIHAQEFESRYEALTMERKLKGWSRAKKLAYIAGDWNAIRVLARGKHRQAPGH